ncbi:MAG: bifunctional diguanylate cyclase/phosphodiesterase, partial [Pseudomonadota bacterium]
LRVGAARAPFISRIGGDEFVVLFDEPHDPTHPHEIAEELVNKLAEPIEFEGRPCRFGASIGIAQAAASEASGLLVQADLALYEAKDGGRGQVSTFSPQLQLALLENRALADEVEMALGDERIVPYFQPILDVETGALVALEALARWRHPERGVLDPPAFLSASEEFGLLGAIDREILSRSVAFFQELASTGLPLPRLAVNVDCTRIHDDALMAGAVSALGAGIPISFELKETVVLEGENDQTRWSIDALREKGVSIEIDDFGSGRASIVALQKVAPDGLKIDQELVLPIVNSEAQRRLVASILDIGRTLSIRVTAEGVETAQHHAILTDMGCHVQQGYFFAEPMTPEATLDFVRRVSAESKGARRA